MNLEEGDMNEFVVMVLALDSTFHRGCCVKSDLSL